MSWLHFEGCPETSDNGQTAKCRCAELGDAYAKKTWTEADKAGFMNVAYGNNRQVVDQPPPIPNERPAVWDLVMKDMQERDLVGRKRYGTPLQPHNGRDALVDAYQEALDLAVYLRQAIYERNNPL